MIILNSIHYIYISSLIIILITLFFRKDIIIPCLISIFIIGVFSTNTILGGFSSLIDSLVFSMSKLSSIIMTIAILTSLSFLLGDIGSDKIIIAPISKIMKNTFSTYWILGIVMFISALFLWPSPAVALIGIILFPVATKRGLSPMGAAITMNIFAFGMALSSDFIIQGAPKITAEAAGIDSNLIVYNSSILFITMSLVTSIASFIMLKKNGGVSKEIYPIEVKISNIPALSKFLAFITPLLFFVDVIIIYFFNLKGSQSTNLITGTALIILIIGSILNYKKASFEKVTEYIKEGLLFGIKIFSPIIIIAAFFYLGSSDANNILNTYISKNGLMNDLAILLSENIPLNKYFVLSIQMLIGALTGLDGSAFSGLSLVGSLANTFGTATSTNISILASAGQITATWMGGGTIIPWATLSVAIVCNVNPIDLARKNLIPVILGFVATYIVACFLI